MTVTVIIYRRHKYDRFMHSIRVHFTGTAKAIEMAGIQNAYKYSVTEFAHPYKLGNKYYSPTSGTYNAIWLTQGGRTAYHGNYCPDDGSYCLYYGNTLLAEGKWNDDRFEAFGHYNYADVRRIIQFGLA